MLSTYPKVTHPTEPGSDKIAVCYADTRLPVTLVLGNAHYQMPVGGVLEIELLYLWAYSPNLNLIESMWRFVKKQARYSQHCDKFAELSRKA